MFAFARRKLRKGGLFLAFTPNGSSDFRSRNQKAWNQLWGMVHPNFLDDRFYQRAFPDVLLASDPYDFGAIGARWTGREAKSLLRLDGGELMAAVKME